MNTTFRLRRSLLVAPALALMGRPAFASPTDTTRFVVGFPAGGFVDTVARILAEGTKGALGGSAIVDGKTGAGGQIAVMDVRGAPPDGTTLLVTPAAMITIYPSSYKTLRYDPRRDLAPVGLIAKFDLSVVVAANSPIRDLADLGRWYRDHPARSGFGTPGAGTGAHFGAYEFLKKLGVETSFAHYRGDPPQVTDILAGALPAGIVVTSVAERYKDKLRILATTGATRSAAFPDSPTLREAGVDVVVSEWLGLFAPRATPPVVIAKLNTALNTALANPDTRGRLVGLGLTPSPVTPDELARDIERDTARWATVVKASGFTAE